MSLGRLIARTTIGGLFAGHGAQKLFGWFGGHGIEGTGQMMGAIGLRPAKAHAAAAGVAEFGGGIALALGVLTPLPNAALIAAMLTAIRTVHAKNGPWSADGGWEYNAVLIGALLALADDEARAKGDDSGRAALVALALGVAGAAGAKFVSDAFPESADESATADQGSAPTEQDAAAEAPTAGAAPADGADGPA